MGLKPSKDTGMMVNGEFVTFREMNEIVSDMNNKTRRNIPYDYKAVPQTDESSKKKYHSHSTSADSKPKSEIQPAQKPIDKTTPKYYVDKLKSIFQHQKIITGDYSVMKPDNKLIFNFGNVIDELLEIDYFMWVEVFDQWAKLFDRNTRLEYVRYCMFTCELLIQIMMKNSNLKENDYSLGKKICYVMHITDCHKEMSKSAVGFTSWKSNFVMDAFLRELTVDNFETYTKLMWYLFENNSQNFDTINQYQWIWITGLIDTKSLREYFIKTVKENTCSTKILCQLLKFNYETDKQYKTIISACIENFENISHIDVIKAYLSYGYVPDSADLQVEIFKILLDSCKSDSKFDLTEVTPRMSTCKIPYFVEFMFKNGVSEYYLIRHVVSQGSSLAFDTVSSLLKEDVFDSKGKHAHNSSFKRVILDYLKLKKGSCSDFYTSYSKWMTSQNINEIIHIAIEQPTTTTDTIQMFIDELAKFNVKSNSDLFICSLDAKNKFFKVLTKHYTRICTK
jgi:hypothetical protein